MQIYPPLNNDDDARVFPWRPARAPGANSLLDLLNRTRFSGRSPWKRLTASLAAGLLLCGIAVETGCATQSPTQVLDADADDHLGGTGLESGDVRAIAERIARGVDDKLRDGGVVSIAQIENASRFRIDTELLRKKLTRDLVMRSKRAHYLASDTGGDYRLVGHMRGLSKTAHAGLSDYLLYSFELVEKRSGAIVWAGDYETKKRAQIDVVYR